VQTSEAGLPPILVVDDNHDNAEIIRQYLEIRGYPITVAYDGDEALALFETVRPALVLLDVMMPGRDGWEVCRLMKQHPVLGTINAKRCSAALTITWRNLLIFQRWPRLCSATSSKCASRPDRRTSTPLRVRPA
jgi:chemotaxis response regulator CheB